MVYRINFHISSNNFFFFFYLTYFSQQNKSVHIMEEGEKGRREDFANGIYQQVNLFIDHAGRRRKGRRGGQGLSSTG